MRVVGLIEPIENILEEPVEEVNETDIPVEEPMEEATEKPKRTRKKAE